MSQHRTPRTWSLWCLTGLLALAAAWADPAEVVAVPLPFVCQSGPCDHYVQAEAHASAVMMGSFNQSADLDTGRIASPTATATRSASGSGASGSATATASGTAGPGDLHGYAAYSAWSALSDPTATGQATGWARWGDTFTVLSSSLATGTPVSLMATLSFHRTLGGTGNLQAYAGISGPVGLSILDTLNTPNPTLSLSAPFTRNVGDAFAFEGWLSFVAAGSAWNNQTPSGLVDASSTSRFTLEVLTAGASCTTASGASYSAAPEPSTLALAALGVAALGLASRAGRPPTPRRRRGSRA